MPTWVRIIATYKKENNKISNHSISITTDTGNLAFTIKRTDNISEAFKRLKMNHTWTMKSLKSKILVPIWTQNSST
jgi:hypothetical protein